MKKLHSLLVCGLLAACTSSFAARLEVDREIMNPNEALTPTSQILVTLTPSVSLDQFIRASGLTYVRTMMSDPDSHVFEAGSVDLARAEAEQLQIWPGVAFSHQIRLVHMTRWSFVPNDPYFVAVSGYPGQWHLYNPYTAGLDVNSMPAWARDVTGSGVHIGIVDDGLERTHPDLSPNYVAADSYDFGQHDSDPMPVTTSDRHGTSVSGVAAARGGNGIGVTGAAPFAFLSGMRVDFSTSTEVDFSDACAYHSSGTNTTVQVKNHSYGYTVPFADDSVEGIGLTASGAAGTIHCFAAGNARGTSAQDSGKQMALNNKVTIAVAALGSNGKASSYSSFGTNVFVTAPSSSSGFYSITTTDRVGSGVGYDTFVNPDYTSAFGGTSSASPLVAGCMAQLKQVSPNANTRMAKHLLARTSKVVDASNTLVDGGWHTNGAGLKFDAQYGFGLIDVNALTQLATVYTGTTTPESSSATQTNAIAIPDNNTTGVSRTFAIADSGKVEDVEITMNITHPKRGHLEGWVTSPAGTKYRFFMMSSSDSGANISWTFLVNGFWGENSAGNWKVSVDDGVATNSGTWNSATLKVNRGEMTSVKPISAHIDLQALTASPSGRQVTLYVYRAGSTTPYATTTQSLNASGNVTFNPILPDGTYDLAIKSSHWLRSRQNNKSLTPSGTSGLNFSLINGDITNDNVVDASDYFALSDAYETINGDSAYDVEADLNGDGAVDASDYFILSDSYELSGD